MNRYLYCFCSELDDEAFPAGVDGLPVRTIRMGNITAVVSDLAVPSVRSVRSEARNALRHHEVVSRILDCTTPLPCRFGTVVTDQALEAIVATEAVEISRLLETVRGRVEMDLKLNWDAEAAPGVRSDVESEDGWWVGQGAPAGPGTGFLMQRRRAARSKQLLEARIRDLAAAVTEPLGKLACDTVYLIRIREDRIPEAEVAHLIEKTRVADYRDLLTAMGSRSGETRMRVSGPWAPYSFAAKRWARAPIAPVASIAMDAGDIGGR